MLTPADGRSPSAGSRTGDLMYIESIYLGIVAVASVTTFALYLLDKRRASRGRWRISEAAMHIAELLGGWPGGIIARRSLRHKSRKLRFRIISWLITGLHIVAITLWLIVVFDLLP